MPLYILICFLEAYTLELQIGDTFKHNKTYLHFMCYTLQEDISIKREKIMIKSPDNAIVVAIT